MPAAFPPATLPTDPRAHLAFVEVMASVDESEPPWRPTVAGFLALRLVDRWADSCSDRTVLSPRELSAVRNAVSEAPAGPIREALSRLVAAIADSWGRRTASVTIALLAYAHLLQHDEEYGIAADAYQTFLSHADAASDDVELLPDAYLRLGYCLRVSGRVDAAAVAYESAAMFAGATGDVRAGLLSRIGSAAVLQHRGNLPCAAAELDLVIADVAQMAGESPSPALADVLARAKHDSGAIAYHRGQFERAALLYHDAFENYQDELRRERLLADIATNFASLGMRDAARDAHLVNYVAARAPFIRLLAGINLMELASLDGQETVFQEYRRELAEVSLPPALLPYYHLYVGEGCYRFRRTQCARVALDKAIVVATERQMNEVLIRAEAMLKRLEQRQVPEPVAQVAQTPAVLAEPVRVIRELRERIWAGAP